MTDEGDPAPAPSIEALLAGAHVLVDEYGDYDAEGARQQIAQTVSSTVWMGAASLDNWTRSLRKAAGIAADQPADDGPTEGGHETRPPADTPWHEQAALDLRTLSRFVIHDNDASARLSRLVNSRHIDPEGGLVFACLLYLAGREEGAQFWWQFAAGAGNATAAQCLFLLHMAHGELRDAEHWAVQTADLACELPPYRSLETPPWESSKTPHGAPEASGHAPVLNPALAAAVDRLEYEGDADYGTVPRPGPHLAREVREFAAT
jgi:hypothetical protein